MTELQPILDLLGGKAGWLTTAIAWIAALKTVSALIEVRLQHFFADRLNEFAADSGSDDNVWLRELFSRRWYRATSLLLRFLGVRLPTISDLDRALRHQREAAIEAGGNLRSYPVQPTT